MPIAWLVMAQMAAATPLTPNDIAFRPAGHWPFEAYYPDHAQRLGIDGEVQARCLITENAKLKNCELLSVTPAGEGFDDSAGRLLRGVKVDRVAKDGRPSAGRSAAFTIRYRSTGISSMRRSQGPNYSVTFR